MKTNRMKKNSFLTVALAALTLFSCSEDDSNSQVINPTDPGKDAKIALSFVGNNTKVVSSAVDAEDQVINDASIFVFRTSGVVDVDRQYLAGFASDAPQDIVATTAAKSVYVVTNIGNAAAHTAMFSAVQSEADLKTLVKDRRLDFYSATDAAGETDIRAQDVVMTGNGIVADFAGTTTSTVDIDLAFPLSKIRLIVKDNRINNLTPAGVDSIGKISIVDDKVLLIHAGQSIKLFSEDGGADQAVQSDFYTGWTDPSTFMQYFSDDATSSAATWHTGNDNESTGSTNTLVTHHFYTAANDGDNAATPTVLTIESIKTTWDVLSNSAVTSKIYYPIHFSSVDASTTLVPGKSYVVTLTLSGDVGGGGGTGVVNPLTVVVDASITATITVASWDPVTIDKEIN